MIATIAALSLATSLTLTAIEVPYLPQSEALCGGAAAAMVFRYFGEAHAGVEDFASLVDRQAGGIADTALVAEIERRGWTVDRFDGSLAQLDAHLRAREPVIVLLGDRATRYHYVVVVGHAADRVIVHDPSWGPSREIREAEFVKLWERANFWSLVIRPGDAPPKSSPRVEVAESRPDGCARQTRAALDAVRDRGLAVADEIFAAVGRECPDSAAPMRELAGIRFAQRRWRDAVDFARQALARDPHDAYALDVLGSSLFMLNDPAGALRAWNQIGRPKLDRVRIEGLHHSRYQSIADAVHLSPGALLTADAFEGARRRIDDLPDRVTARLDVRPDADGFATVDIVIAERSSVPRDVASWRAIGLGAAVDREVVVTLPGFSGQGEIWTASGRLWANRPRVDLGFIAPRFAGLPGVWRVDASWDAQTYAFANSSALLRESRTHAGIGVSDWLSADWRYSVFGGLDEWSGGRRAASVGASIERRLLRDQVSIVAQGETWVTHGSVPSFDSLIVRTGWTSAPVIGGWSYAAAVGLQRVSDNAPLGLWGGAGDGHARAELLRAHPMLDDGVINVTGASVFGKSLAFGNVEAQRWFDRSWPVRFGIAGFSDAAHASRSIDGVMEPLQVDVGVGLRARIPGVKRVLRVDVAHGVRDGANALTVGWVF